MHRPFNARDEKNIKNENARLGAKQISRADSLISCFAVPDEFAAIDWWLAYLSSREWEFARKKMLA